MTVYQQLYNPAFLSKEQLRESFSVRQSTLSKLLGFVAEEAPDKPRKHTIIVGPRGMGKSTLGLRLMHKIEEDCDLSEAWQPLPFDEESYEIADAADFWLTALHHLSRATGDPTWAESATALAQGETDSRRVEAYAINLLDEYCDESKMRLILFVENIDAILDQLHGKREVHAIRATLTTNPNFLVLGSANSVFAGIQEYSAPFYGFFRVIRLDGLNVEETIVLIRAMAKRFDQPNPDKLLSSERGRVEAIRRLTGGNPRLLALACQMLFEPRLGTTLENIERLIDEQTPYFKARIEDLPVQSRKVFSKLADGWRPMLANEVASRTRLGSSQASAQLNKLVDWGYAVKVNWNNEKRVRYEVSDRFFNIYYLYRFSRAARDRMEHLVAFLYDLFGPTEMRSLYLDASREIKKGSHGGTDAKESLKSLAQYVIRDVEFKEGPAWANELPELIQKGESTPSPCTEHSNYVTKWVNLGDELNDDGRQNIAISAYLRALESIISNLTDRKLETDENIGYLIEVDAIETIFKKIKEIQSRTIVGGNLHHHWNEFHVISGLAHLALGQAWLLMKRRDNAIASIQESVKDAQGIRNVRDEDERDFLLRLHLHLIPFLDEFGFDEELIDVVNRALEVSESNDAVRREGQVIRMIEACGRLIKLERYPELEEICTKITSKFPDLDSGWRLFAICVSSQKGKSEMADAKKYVDEAIARGPNNVWNHYASFVVFCKLGEWNNGLNRLEYCLESGINFFKGELSRITNILIEATCAGEGRRVMSIIENAKITNELEPLWHALRVRQGEDLEPLPREIMDAVEHIKQRFEVSESNWK